MAEKYKVYLVDRRGCGKSEKNCLLSYEETAKDIFEFITKLNIDKPIVLGHSGGGSTLLHLAIRYTDSISKIILCSAVATKQKLNYPKYFSILNKLPWYPGKKLNDKFLKMNDEMKEISKDLLGNIKNKTLIINAKDEIVPLSEAKYINEGIVDSKLLILSTGLTLADLPLSSDSATLFSNIGKNKDFMINSISELTDKTNYLKIRKGMDSTTFQATAKESFIVLTICLAMPLVIIIMGFVVLIYNFL